MPRELTTDDLADEWADRQSRRTGCRCAGDMPGRCPGPQSCPMCEPSESELVAADLAANQNKAERARESADARALLDQVMLQTLLRSSL